jgi:hypothetical protein
MKPLVQKPCRICGKPVTRKRRNDRQSFYYPRQCDGCFKKSRDEGARKQRISEAMSGMSNPRSQPLFTERIVNRRGFQYIQIKVSPTGRWPYKHRWMMEQLLGRKLLSSENVHHINGNTLDNCYDNFKVVSHQGHKDAHKLIKWSIKYDSCLFCGTTSKKHISLGLCSTCYQRKRRDELGYWD